MQGRLSPIERDRLQTFPFSNWKNEFEIAHKNNFFLIEWTIDTYNIDENPIFFDNGLKEIKDYQFKYSIHLDSVTCDFFMENPIFNKKNNKINPLDYVIKLFSLDLNIKTLISTDEHNFYLYFVNKESNSVFICPESAVKQKS